MLFERRNSALASSEFPQIVVLRRQNDGGGGGALLAIADEAQLVRFHGPVEIVEVRVLAITVGVDPGGFGVGFGADDLGALGALGEDRLRLLLTRAAHTVERG